MAKSKLATPDWILKGEKKPSKKKTNEKTFKIKKCPKCGSENINVVLTGEEGSDEDESFATSPKRGQSKGRGEWECKECKWNGVNIKEEELNEEEFMKYLDEKGVEVA